MGKKRKIIKKRSKRLQNVMIKNLQQTQKKNKKGAQRKL